MGNLNSKRWFSILALYGIYIYLLLKGTYWGFPEGTSSTIWSFISGQYTALIQWVTAIFIVGESWKHIQEKFKK